MTRLSLSDAADADRSVAATEAVAGIECTDSVCIVL